MIIRMFTKRGRMLRAWCKTRPGLCLSWDVRGNLLDICMGCHGLVWRGGWYDITQDILDCIIRRHTKKCGCSWAVHSIGDFEGILK